jgi:hypothetical protein
VILAPLSLILVGGVVAKLNEAVLGGFLDMRERKTTMVNRVEYMEGAI